MLSVYTLTMPSESDFERAFYAAQAGLTDAVASTKSVQELRGLFLQSVLIKTPNPKTTVTTTNTTGTVSPATAAYVPTELTAVVDSLRALSTQFNTLRTALITAGLIQ